MSGRFISSVAFFPPLVFHDHLTLIIPFHTGQIHVNATDRKTLIIPQEGLCNTQFREQYKS